MVNSVNALCMQTRLQIGSAGNGRCFPEAAHGQRYGYRLPTPFCRFHGALKFIQNRKRLEKYRMQAGSEDATAPVDENDDEKTRYESEIVAIAEGGCKCKSIRLAPLCSWPN